MFDVSTSYRMQSACWKAHAFDVMLHTSCVLNVRRERERENEKKSVFWRIHAHQTSCYNKVQVQLASSSNTNSFQSTVWLCYEQWRRHDALNLQSQSTIECIGKCRHTFFFLSPVLLIWREKWSRREKKMQYKHQYDVQMVCNWKKLCDLYTWCEQFRFDLFRCECQ